MRQIFFSYFANCTKNLKKTAKFLLMVQNFGGKRIEQKDQLLKILSMFGSFVS